MIQNLLDISVQMLFEFLMKLNPVTRYFISVGEPAAPAAEPEVLYHRRDGRVLYEAASLR